MIIKEKNIKDRFFIINKFVKIYLLFILTQLFNYSYSQSLDIKFSKEGGIYDKTISIKLKTNNSATIYYTLDGSIPSKKSIKYYDSLIIDSTKVLKAFAYNDSLKSEIITHSYILEKRKFNLPVISVTIDNYEMFDPVKGLYSKGLNAESESPYKGANFHKDKELKINIEYFDTTNKLAFNQPAGLKIFGGYSRSLAQKSFSIISREEYGNKDFNYPIFDNLPYKKYKSFILRNSGSDNNRSHFRDILMTSLVKPLSFDVQEYKTCVVFINGEYWGIYNIREKLNEHFLQQHHDVDKDRVTVMKHRDNLKNGERLNYNEIINYISKINFNDTTNIDSLNKLIDINNYLDYNIAETYFANTDAAGNIRYWRTRKENDRWKWLMFDTDFGFGMDDKMAYKKNTIHDFTNKSNEIWPIPAWSTLFIRKLLENDSIKEVYIRKFTTFLNTILETEIVLNKTQELVNTIDYEIDYQHKRWGSNRESWKDEIKRITDFGKYRPYYIRKYLKEKYELTDTFVITIKKPIHGEIIINDFNITEDFNGIFFSDIPNKIQAKTILYYELDKWIGLPGKNTDTSFYLTTNLILEAKFKKKAKIALYGKLKFTEISFKGDDWLELYNSTDSLIDISNWLFLRDSEKEFFIDSNTVIKPYEYLVFSREKSNTDKEYNIKSIKGLFAVRDTSLIELYTNTGNLVDSIQLDSLKGNLIQLIDLNTKSSNRDNWEKSKNPTPTKINYNEKLNKEFKLLLLYGIYPLIGLILLIILIYILVKRFRPHGATE
jgi:hypothetical protein